MKLRCAAFMFIEAQISIYCGLNHCKIIFHIHILVLYTEKDCLSHWNQLVLPVTGVNPYFALANLFALLSKKRELRLHH